MWSELAGRCADVLLGVIGRCAIGGSVADGEVFFPSKYPQKTEIGDPPEQKPLNKNKNV